MTALTASTLSMNEKARTNKQSLNQVLVVVDSYEQWEPYYTSDSVVTIDTYLQDEKFSTSSYLVINLCSDLSYLSEGYYCSLLAQARKHRVLPSIETLNRLDGSIPLKIGHNLPPHSTCQCLSKSDRDNGEYILDLFFGKPKDNNFNKIGRTIFEHYPAPLLRVTISPSSPYQIREIRNLPLEELDDQQQDLFCRQSGPV